jgi:hypothetical protein
VQEIRCPACLVLGYPNSRLSFVVHGEIVVSDNQIIEIQFHCHRCKSDVQWGLGTNEFKIIKLGERNHKPQKASFE